MEKMRFRVSFASRFLKEGEEEFHPSHDDFIQLVDKKEYDVLLEDLKRAQEQAVYYKSIMKLLKDYDVDLIGTLKLIQDIADEKEEQAEWGSPDKLLWQHAHSCVFFLRDLLGEKLPER